jgi:hypothetical protein
MDSAARPLNTGQYDICVILGGMLGPIAVESEPGRSIVISRGRTVVDATGAETYSADSRILFDARDVQRVINALEWARDNAARAVGQGA